MDHETEGRTRPFLLFLLLLCTSGAARAQVWYAGAGIGQSGADTCSSLNLLDQGFSCSGNESSTGWKVFAGYEISRNLAVEGGYVDFGKFQTSASGTIFLQPGTVTGSVKGSGFSLDAVGTLPFGKAFGLFGRIGVLAWSLDATAHRAAPGTPYDGATSGGSASGTSVEFGVGAKYDFNKNLGVRAEFQKFASVGSDATGKSDMSLIAASVVYRFISSFY